MKPDFSVGDAARVVGIDAGRLRGWLQHSHIEFGRRTATGRIKFSLRDVRAIALMAAAVDHGVPPAQAGPQAARLVDRLGTWTDRPLIAVWTHNPSVAPYVAPEGAAGRFRGAAIVIPLKSLFAELDRRAA